MSLYIFTLLLLAFMKFHHGVKVLAYSSCRLPTVHVHALSVFLYTHQAAAFFLTAFDLYFLPVSFRVRLLLAKVTEGFDAGRASPVDIPSGIV